jgi:tetratricopeptide (TPR) repeat protein
MIVLSITAAFPAVFFPMKRSEIRTGSNITFQKIGNELYRGFVRSPEDLQRIEDHLREEVPARGDYSLAYCVCKDNRGIISAAYAKRSNGALLTEAAAGELAEHYGGCFKPPVTRTIVRVLPTSKVQEAALAGGSKENGPSAQALFAEAKRLEDTGDRTGALEKLARLLKAEPNNYIAVLRSAQLLFREKELTQAAEYYRTAASLKPHAVEPLLGLLECLSAEQQWNEARLAAREVLALDPASYTARTKLAAALRAVGKEKKSNAVLVEVRLRYPLSFEISAERNRKIARIFAESVSLEQAGDLKGALKRVLSIIRLKPDHYPANLRAAWLSLQLGQNTQSVTRYRNAAKTRPEAIEPLLGMLKPLAALKKWDEASVAARKIRTVDPFNYAAVSTLAFAEFLRGAYSQALPLYARLAELYPSDTDMTLGLAWTYYRLGRLRRAADMFLSVLKVQPADKSAAQGVQLCAAGF